MAPTSSERPWDRGNPWRYVSVASRQNRVESLFTSLIISIACALSLISTSIQCFCITVIVLYITFLPLTKKITHIFTGCVNEFLSITTSLLLQWSYPKDGLRNPVVFMVRRKMCTSLQSFPDSLRILPHNHRMRGELLVICIFMTF